MISSRYAVHRQVGHARTKAGEKSKKGFAVRRPYSVNGTVPNFWFSWTNLCPAEIFGAFADDNLKLELMRLPGKMCPTLVIMWLGKRAIADEDSRDIEVLKRTALQRMALDYKRRR